MWRRVEHPSLWDRIFGGLEYTSGSWWEFDSSVWKPGPEYTELLRTAMEVRRRQVQSFTGV